MIPFKNRFHGHNSLRYVYKNGAVVRSRLATLKTSPNDRRGESRIAVVISKKVLKSAVRRNRVRRRIYEQLRIALPRIKKTHDIVIIVTMSEFLTMEAPELEAHINQLLIQASLY